MTTETLTPAVRVAMLAESYAEMSVANAKVAHGMALAGDLANAAQLAGEAKAYGTVARRLVILAKELI